MATADPKNAYRCHGVMTTGGGRCYFNVQPGDDYCPGHQSDPDVGVDTAALGAYQAKHGIDYPCGRDGDVERVFDPKERGHYFTSGEARPITPEDVQKRLDACDEALEALDEHGRKYPVRPKDPDE